MYIKHRKTKCNVTNNFKKILMHVFVIVFFYYCRVKIWSTNLWRLSAEKIGKINFYSGSSAKEQILD